VQVTPSRNSQEARPLSTNVHAASSGELAVLLFKHSVAVFLILCLEAQILILAGTSPRLFPTHSSSPLAGPEPRPGGHLSQPLSRRAPYYIRTVARVWVPHGGHLPGGALAAPVHLVLPPVRSRDRPAVPGRVGH
jgi:hypothetical protein